MTTFLDVVRKAGQRKHKHLIIKGGKGSGWFAPPKGTHTKGAKAKARAGKKRLKGRKDLQKWIMDDPKGYAKYLQQEHRRMGGKRGKLSEWVSVMLPSGHKIRVREAQHKRFGKKETYMEVRHLGVGAPWYRISVESGDFRKMGTYRS